MLDGDRSGLPSGIDRSPLMFVRTYVVQSGRRRSETGGGSSWNNFRRPLSAGFLHSSFSERVMRGET
jgi:hypothetical protein